MKEYHNKVVEIVGYNLHYLEHYRGINLTNFNNVDIDILTNEWIAKYQGRTFEPGESLQSNIFKCQVDQMVHSIIAATEDEIHRRVNEEICRYHEKFGNKVLKAGE